MMVALGAALFVIVPTLAGLDPGDLSRVIRGCGTNLARAARRGVGLGGLVDRAPAGSVGERSPARMSTGLLNLPHLLPTLTMS